MHHGMSWAARINWGITLGVSIVVPLIILAIQKFYRRRLNLQIVQVTFTSVVTVSTINYGLFFWQLYTDMADSDHLKPTHRPALRLK